MENIMEILNRMVGNDSDCQLKFKQMEMLGEKADKIMLLEKPQKPYLNQIQEQAV